MSQVKRLTATFFVPVFMTIACATDRVQNRSGKSSVQTVDDASSYSDSSIQSETTAVQIGEVESAIPETSLGYGQCTYKCQKSLFSFGWYFQHKGNCDSQIYCSRPSVECDESTRGQLMDGYCYNYPGQSVP